MAFWFKVQGFRVWEFRATVRVLGFRFLGSRV